MNKTDETQIQTELETELEKPAVEIIKELKESTVPKEKFDKTVQKLQADNKRLLEIIKGEAEEPEEKTVEDLRQELSKSRLKNLDFVKSALELRKKVLAVDGYDIFESQNRIVGGVKDESQGRGEKVATFLANCVERSGNSPAVFNSLMNENLVEQPRPRRR